MNQRIKKPRKYSVTVYLTKKIVIGEKEIKRVKIIVKKKKGRKRGMNKRKEEEVL